MHPNNEKANLCLDSSFDINLAINWLNNSGIQNSNGGFHAWYDTKKGKYSFLYPEATAYAIQFFSRLYSKDKKNLYLSKAIKSGEWLLSIQENDGSFKCKYFDDSEPDRHDGSFYVFDAGIITSSFLDLHRDTSKISYLKAAIKMMNLILKYQNFDGSFNPGLHSNGDLIKNNHWSQTSSCHHIKLLLPLLRLNHITKDRKYLDSAKKLLQWSNNLQLTNGRFVTFQGSNDTYLHAHCYALEGLIGAIGSLDITPNSSHFKKVRKGINWLLKIQNKDGSIYNWNGRFGDKIKVSDALSQALRLLLLSRKLIYLDKNYDTINEALCRGFAYLSKMQQYSGSNQILGGVSYGEENNERLTHVNTIATIFAVHATLLKKSAITLPLLDEIF